jgi:hypothetical protein
VSVVVPRLDRGSALELFERHRESSVPEISAAMPETNVVLTYSPVGGRRIDTGELAQLRTSLMEIAREHGMPDAISDVSGWEAKSARAIHAGLCMTAHEASHDEVWSFITCCWLLDLAVWRFGSDANVDRFVGHLNRNTFRRMWWRAEVFGADIDLAKLGEDELVNIMERPTLFSDRRLARAIASEMIERVATGVAVERMRLMREATKRLLRLTPFVAFAALDDQQIRLVVADAFDAAADGVAGKRAAMPNRVGDFSPAAAAEVREIGRLEIAPPTDQLPESLEDATRESNFDDVATAAISIAKLTGRVTNTSLREAVPFITSEEARDVFHVLIDRGVLARRGVKRGTHYVIPGGMDEVAVAAESLSSPVLPADILDSSLGGTDPIPPRQGVYPADPPAETTLRRLLRRIR